MSIPKGYISKHKFWENGRKPEEAHWWPKRPQTEEELEKLIEDWHTSYNELLLHEFLGWTWEEYKTWVETEQIPK